MSPSRVSTTKRITSAESIATLDLLLDLLGEVVDILDAHAAGIDHFHEAIAELDRWVTRSRVTPEVGSTIARRFPGEPIENARLAYVGPADDDNLRNTHDSSILL